MTPTPSTYDELAQNVLRSYLRSAVIIDDQWPETEIGEQYAEEPDESILINDKIPDDTIAEDLGQLASDVPPWRPRDNPEDARLLAELQQALLRNGLLACGFRYTHEARDIAVQLARSADIVVLDWHLIEDDGADALDILEQLRGNELRFVCIFTGHGRISEVSHALRERFGMASDDLRADLQIDNMIIVIRNKEGIGEETPGYTVEPDKLLAEALGGLASNFDGLVQLTMLELTQQHRRHLPAILKRFDEAIDTAVLLEAGDDLSPVGQGGAFLAVLVDEWRACLEENSSSLQALGPRGRQLFGARLAERFRGISEQDLKRALDKTGITAASVLGNERNRLLTQEWLAGGCAGLVPGIPLGKEKRPLARWGVLQAISGSIDEDPAVPLLRLDALFHQQFEPPEALTQGTLVARLDEYFLCITPACDAERPEGFANLFTFLLTKPISPKSLFSQKSRKDAYCVVDSEKGLLCLEVLLKQRLVLEVKERRFDDAGYVQGHLTLSDHEAAGPIRLHRIAQLRLEHALAITAAASAVAARVGVNRVEFIRSRLS